MAFENSPFEKQRVIQEFVPGKQVTMAHLIANPMPGLYKKLGVIGNPSGALGIMTITPSEAAIIGADVASKAANVEVVFVDRFNGSLVISGDVAFSMCDTFNGLMMLPNLVTLLYLSGTVKQVTDNYIRRRIRREPIAPMLSYHPRIQRQMMHDDTA